MSTPAASPSDQDADRRLVVVTGAAGRVGALTTAHLAGRYRLRLVDLEWPDGERSGGDEVERLALDLREGDAWTAVLDAADVVVHLAAQPSPGIGVREAIEDVAMPTALLAAAAGGTLRKVVFASSIHSMGLYDRQGRYPIRPQWPARPCCEYGTAKVFSENLLGVLGQRRRIDVVCLRLGLTGALPTTPHAASQWLGSEDYGRLLDGALTTSVGYGTYFGVSVAAAARWDLSNSQRDLGYVPEEQPPATEEPDTGPQGNCLMG